MALRALMLKKSIDTKRAELQALEERDAGFEAREAELETAIEEAASPEEQQTVNEQIEQFEADKNAHEVAKSALTEEIAQLEDELREEEKKKPVRSERTNIPERTERGVRM